MARERAGRAGTAARAQGALGRAITRLLASSARSHVHAAPRPLRQ